MKVTFLLLISLIACCIHTVNSECQLVEIHKEDPFILRVKTPSQYCIYYDITSMNPETEGELTFIISHGLLINNHIKQFNAKSISLPEQTLSELHFPIKKESGHYYFPIESAFENKYYSALNSMKHLYFRRENINDDGHTKVFLVIYLDIDIQTTDSYSYYEIDILSPVFSQDITTIDLAGETPLQFNGFNFTLSPQIPKYLRIHYSDEIIRNNYILFSKGKLFTYTCGSFLLKRKDDYIINPNRHYGYFIDFKSLNSNSRVCSSLLVKLVITNPSDYEIQLKLEYLNLPFKGLPVLDMYQTSYSVNVEINDIADQYNLLGVFPNIKTIDSNYYVHANYFFGIGEIFYKSSNNLQDIKEPYVPNSQDYIHYSNSSFLMKLENNNNELNIFHIKCETYCLVHFELFEIFNEDIEDDSNSFNNLNIEFPGVYYFNINKGIIFYVKFINFLKFNYELENLNGEEIEGVIEFENFGLNSTNTIRRGTINYLADYEDISVEMNLKSNKNNALLKLKLNYLDDIEEIKINTHKTHNIGNYKYTYRTFLFKFPLDDIIYDSYQIQILSKDDSNLDIKTPISLYSCFDLGNANHFILPSPYNAHIDYLAEPSYKFTAEISNPYDRPYSIIPKSDTKMFYYYAVRFQDYENESNVFVAFTGAEKPKYLYLSQNLMVTIDINKNNNNNTYLLQKGGKYRDSSLVVNFYKCDNNKDASFQITQLNKKIITEDTIRKNRLRIISKDIGIDYIIKFDSNTNSKLIMYYSYESNANLLQLKEYENNTVYYKVIHSKNTNNIAIKFKPYFMEGKKVSYFVYLYPYEENNNDKCSFLDKTSISSLIHNDTNGSDIDTTIYNIEPGSYWLQIVGKEAHNYHSFKIYDRVHIQINAFSQMSLSIMKILIFMLSISSFIMVLFIFKTTGRLFNYKKIKHSYTKKQYSSMSNAKSTQLEEK